MIGRLLKAGVVAAAVLVSAPLAQAQEFTFKLHQLLPEKASVPAGFLIPWSEKIMKESGGRIKIEHYPSMQLGGKPPALIDQVTDGAVDMIWTVMGYTPGRFPKSEAFELPFMVSNAEATSRAALIIAIARFGASPQEASSAGASAAMVAAEGTSRSGQLEPGTRTDVPQRPTMRRWIRTASPDSISCAVIAQRSASQSCPVRRGRSHGRRLISGPSRGSRLKRA